MGMIAGTAVVGVYVGLRRWARRMARAAGDTRRALRYTLGGMIVRMVVVLGLAAGLLAATPVHATAFGATLAALLLVSMLAEVGGAARRWL